MANSGDKFLYFLIGGFVGASVALLFAPKSGTETRELLESKYRQGREDLNQKVRAGREYVSETRRDLEGKITDTIGKGRESVTRQKDQLASAIEAGKKAYQEEKGKLEETGESGS